MNTSSKLLFALLTALLLGGAGLPVHSATLNAGDLLTVGGGSWLALDMDGDMSISGAEMATIQAGSDGGIRIGALQGVGAIDSWEWFGLPGNHYTTLAPTGGVGGIDFSGWSIFFNGEPIVAAVDYGAWTPVNCVTLGCDEVGFVDGIASFSWSGVYGDSYSLWYSWRYQDAAPGTQVATNYLLHLEGVVLSEVPVPAAVWLLGSGLLGLLGMARRRTR